MTSSWTQRIDQLRAIARDNGLDAIVVAPSPTFHYLTGVSFKLLERPKVLLVPVSGQPIMVLPRIEAERWRKLNLDSILITWQDETGFAGAYAQLADHVQAKAIGIESLGLRYQEYAAISAVYPGARFQDVQVQTTAMRAHKQPDELAHIRNAIRYSEAALEKTFAAAKVGMTELEVQSILFSALLEHPLKDISEPVCVAGVKTAQPHGRAGDYRLQRGDALLIDFAIKAEGYYADITRTVFLETVSDDHRAFYNVVLEANKLGIEMSRPGISCNDLDDACMKLLEASPYGQFILHKVGHGIGLDVHEPPMVMRGNKGLLEVGHVLTIEPGLYDPNQLGVRIEDDILITEGGCEVLTSFPRELMIVG